jgi:acyl-CoA synthetase (AMP-forming)/AMP-acid ligase II
VRDWAAREPERPVLLAEGRRPMTYGELADLIDHYRLSINEAGLGRGDRVAVMHSGGAGMAAVCLGLIDAVTIVPLNPKSTADEIVEQLQRRGARALVAESGHQSDAPAAAERLGLPVHWVEESDASVAAASRLRTSSSAPAVRPGVTEADDTALILGTSGTSGKSKVVPISQRKLVAGSHALIKLYALTRDDRALMLQPMYYSSGLNSIGYTAVSGGSLVLMPEFDVERFFRLLLTQEPTWYGGSYTFQMQIEAHASRYKDAIAKSRLRLFRTMSGALDQNIADSLAQKLGVPIYERYGSTEAGTVTGQPLPRTPRKPGTVGRAIDCEVAIMGPDGELLPAGERGEVLVKGPCVFDGYENDPETNAQAFVDGWYRTADEGFLDDEGYLTLTGRIKELINRGGEKINPTEVDAALMAHPGVREAVCFPIPHPSLGEEVAAVVVLKPGANLSVGELRGDLAERIAGFKVPKHIVFAEVIPKNATGKAQRYKLADIYGVKIRAR